MHVAILCLSTFLCADPGTATLPPLAVANSLPSHQHCRETHERLARQVCELRRWSNELWVHQDLPGYAVASWNIWGRAESIAEQGRVWGLACEATDWLATPGARRRALQRLIDSLGWRAVMTGQIPYPSLEIEP